MTHAHRVRRRTKLAARSLLLSISYLALEAMLGASGVHAQSTPQAPGASLPPVTVTAPETKRRASASRAQPSARTAQRRRTQTARRPEPAAAPKTASLSQDARTGTDGVYANSTSVATKTNTPLINIPQSLSVITKDFIRDQAPTGLTDVTRYVPGVAVHQGEGNRDELVIRGVDTRAGWD
jgi:catecholate siderophore receptor